MACNDCLCVTDDYVYKIIRDPADDTLLRAYLYSNENVSWHEGQIKTIKIQNGKLVVEYFTDGVEVLDPEGFDIQALQSITDNGDGSFTIIDRDGINTVIPAGFPSGVIYGDGEFTLITDDGQALTIDLYRSLGCYVKCVSLDCNNDLVFTMVGDSCCAPSGSLTVHIPEADEITNIKDITTTDNVLYQVLKQDGSIMYIDTNAIVTITSGSLTKPAILIRDKYGATDVVNLNTSNTSSYDNATKTLTITINGVSQTINLQGLASGFSSFLGSYATDAEVQALPAVDGNWAISLETGLPDIWYYVMGTWVDSGTVLAVDLTNYYNKNEIDGLLIPITDTIDLLDTTVTALTLDIQQAVQDINVIKLEQIEQNLEISLLQNKNQNQDDAISDIESILDIVQKFKLTEDNTGFSKSVITSITDLEDATSGFYSAYPNLVESITGINEAGWFIVHSNSTSGSVILHTADSNELWIATKVSDSLGSFVKVNGGSTADLSNYQTPKLTADLGEMKVVLTSTTELIDAIKGGSGFYGVQNTLIPNGIVGKMIVLPFNQSGVYNTGIVSTGNVGDIDNTYLVTVNSTGDDVVWEELGAETDLTNYYTKIESDEKFISKTGNDDIAVDAEYSNGIISILFGTSTFAVRTASTGAINRLAISDANSVLSSPDESKRLIINNTGNVIEGDRLYLNTIVPGNEHLISSDVETFQKYKLTQETGKNLQEVLDESTLFSLPPGFYDKGSYDIGGDSSSGMIHIYDYGNLSGYKKANAYFSNEIWTATFKSTGFSGGGWVKIAEPIVDGPGDLSTIDTLTTSREFFDWIADSTFDSVFTPLYVYITGENSSIITGDSTSRMFLAEMIPGYTPSTRRLNIYGREVYTIDVDVYNLSIPTVFGLMYDMVYDSYSHSETVVSTDITAGVDIITPVTILLSERRRSIKIDLTGVLTSSTPNETITFELFVNDVSKGTITYDGGTNSTSNIYESNIHTVGSNDIIRVVATGSTTVAGFVKIKQV